MTLPQQAVMFVMLTLITVVIWNTDVSHRSSSAIITVKFIVTLLLVGPMLWALTIGGFFA